jgi:hypothetical protein
MSYDFLRKSERLECIPNILCSALVVVAVRYWIDFYMMMLHGVCSIVPSLSIRRLLLVNRAVVL